MDVGGLGVGWEFASGGGVGWGEARLARGSEELELGAGAPAAASNRKSASASGLEEISGGGAREGSLRGDWTRIFRTPPGEGRSQQNLLNPSFLLLRRLCTSSGCIPSPGKTGPSARGMGAAGALLALLPALFLRTW